MMGKELMGVNLYDIKACWGIFMDHTQFGAPYMMPLLLDRAGPLNFDDVVAMFAGIIICSRLVAVSS